MWYSKSVWSGIQAMKSVRTPQFAVVGLDKHQARLLPISIALLLLTPRAKIHQNELRGFLLLDSLMRYVDGQVWDTRLHEQARTGSVGEFLERGG